MANDIVPELLAQIQKDFEEAYKDNSKVKNALKKIKKGTATHTDSNEFAEALGDILSQSFAKKLSSEALPGGKMYYNIADRIINETLGQNYKLISDYAAKVQNQLNQQSGISFKAVKPIKNQEKIDGIINKIASADNYDEVAWVLDEPVVNFSQSIVDDTIKANADFHNKLGMKPKIERISAGHCCDWCIALAGKYAYPDVPKDIFRRHRFCRCTVEYNPGDGKKQNVHTKKWINPEESERIEQRKIANVYKKLSINDVQFGKKAGKHMMDYGLDANSRDDRIVFKHVINNIAKNPDYTVDDISWRGFKEPVKAYIKNGDAVLATKNNEFITIMKGGAENERIKNKRR
ncbi:hypothetical protein SAMN02910327_00412 [Peptostreptococcaceae bacterium pGA-8]|nr:hypothetical protein SAMN02910327_00412 [Peptostreptococcaceae bacterium pGA-8]